MSGTSSTAASATSTQSQTALLASLREEVICTTCLSLPRVPMLQCQNGHLICKDCTTKFSGPCPTCKMPTGVIRSIVADKVRGQELRL